MTIFPRMSVAQPLLPGPSRLYMAAYGFEDRSLGWVKSQPPSTTALHEGFIFRYRHPKGRNRIADMQAALRKLGVRKPDEAAYDSLIPQRIEDEIFRKLPPVVCSADEVILDISAMTKLLILVSLWCLRDFSKTVKIVYSEGETYAPTEKEYEESERDMAVIARFPSRGVESVVRLKSLTSIRMQGQPISVIAFTSFNEQLVRHMLGALSPHRLLFINGRPPRPEYGWRERATQEIHARLIQEYTADNPVDNRGLLRRVASTLDYRETVARIEEAYRELGMLERLICAATGSKMQTVGVFFAKCAHPDLHVEYPTPDSYFVKGLSTGVRSVHEIVIPGFSTFLHRLRSDGLHAHPQTELQGNPA